MAEDQTQGTPEGWTQSSPNQEPHEPGDGAGPASAPISGVAPPPQPFFMRKRLLLLPAVLIFLGGGGTLFVLYVINIPPIRSDIPVPTQSTVVQQFTCAQDLHCWIVTVDNTTCKAVNDFYAAQLPSNGWGNVQVYYDGGPGDPTSSFDLVANKPGQGLRITCGPEAGLEGNTVVAPSGGVALLFIAP